MVSRPITKVFAGILLCLGLCLSLSASAQQSEFKVDAEWAQLPGGGTWDGSTSWITADGKGNVIVLVRVAPYFRMFTRDGKFVRAWGEDGMFDTAHSVTVGPDGAMWVTDSTDHVVKKVSLEGEVLLTLGKKGEAGDNTSQDKFNQPNHVGFAINGDVYVSDGYVNARVVHFTPEGKFVRIIGGIQGAEPGQVQVPHGVVVDANGRILVNDSDNARVSVFDKDGKFVESWPYPSRGGIVIGADNNIYVSDVNAGIVNIVNPKGELIDSVNVDRAHGLGVDTDGSIYVSGASRMTVMKVTR
jgi:sugar lactone lactonase YvrE